jgi:MFS transporter, DHA3 family, macrolide efflux protein
MVKNDSFTNKYTFFIIWVGQFISIVGSGLTGFALGVTLFQQTGKATDFILITAFTVVPSILLSPLAGTIIDRYNRRIIMLFADMVAGMSTFFVIALITSNQLEIWHIYLVTVINASANTFQFPAYAALTAQVVPNQYLPRANGLVSLGESISGIGAPIVAGFVVATFGLEAVLLIDVATFLFAVSSLLVIRIPNVNTTDAQKPESINMLQGVKTGWSFITQRPGLRSLLLFTVVLGIIAVPELLLTPLVLSFASESDLGIVLGSGGLGYLVGSLLITSWGGPKHLILSIVGIEFITGIATVTIALKASIPLISIAVFVHYFTFAFSATASTTIWQRKVPQALHGRVFTLQRMINWLALSLVLVLAGPMVDNIFEPFMQSGNPLANQIGSVIGTGDGRGIALIMAISGTMNIVLAIVAMSYKPLRHLEADLPDEN